MASISTGVRVMSLESKLLDALRIRSNFGNAISNTKRRITGGGS